MPFGTPKNPSVNPMTQMPPKAPSALVKTGRWAMFLSGIFYGAWRLNSLKPVQEAINERDEILHEFIKARKYRFFIDKGDEDAYLLLKQVQGEPAGELPEIRKPLLLDDE
ncbi:uncharacterized protein LOC132714561 [Ruditapes philippinarum]|uniref:uncharacterized protein LOC132714561 n=1 Tax=Ruditapes philippinarum TaxID=129788 RepID=UPI00295B6C7E|nr:uncharacterized protein LOC132714561 [Ruditapes philippinarum]